MHAQRAHFGPEMAGKFVCLVDIGSESHNLFGSETAHRLAHHVGGFAQPEIQMFAHVTSFGTGRGLRSSSMATKVKTASVTLAERPPARSRCQASTAIFMEVRPTEMTVA